MCTPWLSVLIRARSPAPAGFERPTHFPIVRGSAINGPGWPAGDARNALRIIELGMVARHGPIREANQDRRAKRVCPKGENRLKPIRVNRTIDTRIFSTGESRRGREEAEDREGVAGGPTEPPSPTEPIPSPADRTSHRTGVEGHAGQEVAVGWTERAPNRWRVPRASGLAPATLTERTVGYAAAALLRGYLTVRSG